MELCDDTSKLYCDCSVCKAWDGETEGSWECLKIECGCGEKVFLIAEKNDDRINTTYVCGKASLCGFYVHADDDCSVYVSIIRHLLCFMFLFEREMCMCQTNTIAVLLRITEGLVPDPPAPPPINTS